MCCWINRRAGSKTIKADYGWIYHSGSFSWCGYGLDFAERYRNLPFVGILHPHVYKQACKKVSEVETHKEEPLHFRRLASQGERDNG